MLGDFQEERLPEGHGSSPSMGADEWILGTGQLFCLQLLQTLTFHLSLKVIPQPCHVLLLFLPRRKHWSDIGLPHRQRWRVAPPSPQAELWLRAAAGWGSMPNLPGVDSSPASRWQAPALSAPPSRCACPCASPFRGLGDPSGPASWKQCPLPSAP